MSLRFVVTGVGGALMFLAAGCAVAVDDFGTPKQQPVSHADSGIGTGHDTGTGVVDPFDGAPLPPEDSAPPEEDTAPPDTGAPDTDPPPRDATVDSTGDPCSDCVNASCSGQVSACLADTECSAQMDCLSTCSDSTCAAACATAHPSTSFDDLMSCVTSTCSAECGAPPP
jgi:hypothetical protein